MIRILVTCLLTLLPITPFMFPASTIGELVQRFSVYGLGVAVVACVGHTLSLPLWSQKEWGPTKLDDWGKTLRWNASVSAVIGLFITVVLIPGVS